MAKEKKAYRVSLLHPFFRKQGEGSRHTIGLDWDNVYGRFEDPSSADCVECVSQIYLQHKTLLMGYCVEEVSESMCHLLRGGWHCHANLVRVKGGVEFRLTELDQDLAYQPTECLPYRYWSHPSCRFGKW